ncbi:peptidase C39 family protein [Microbacterium tumbae]
MPRTLVLPYVAATIPERAFGLFADETIQRWASAERSARSPEIVAVVDGDEWLCAALVSARTGSAYLKIVDAAGDRALLIVALIELAGSRGLVQVKWEGWTVDAVDAAALGFAALRPPLESAIGTDEPESGYVRWLVDAEVAEPPYYRQTESFTCGAVVSLMARTRTGEETFDRAAELAFWRTANNFPACEPVGLGVAVRRRWPAARVRISLDAARPVMVGHLPEAEQEWRAVLQRSSRADAVALGLPIEERRMPISEIREAIAEGEQVLLALSLERMQGFAVPHWVLCHAGVPGAILVEDPWASAATGDTWVDAHLLPIADASLDDMAALEEDGYRGVVRIG